MALWSNWRKRDSFSTSLTPAPAYLSEGGSPAQAGRIPNRAVEIGSRTFTPNSHAIGGKVRPVQSEAAGIGIRSPSSTLTVSRLCTGRSDHGFPGRLCCGRMFVLDRNRRAGRC